MSTRSIAPEGVHPDERLGQDDMATRREGEFLAAALELQRDRAAASRAAAEGVKRLGRCFNCGELCLPQAVYCDLDCRADHEKRLRVRARQGGSAR